MRQSGGDGPDCDWVGWAPYTILSCCHTIGFVVGGASFYSAHPTHDFQIDSLCRPHSRDCVTPGLFEDPVSCDVISKAGDACGFVSNVFPGRGSQALGSFTDVVLEWRSRRLVGLFTARANLSTFVPTQFDPGFEGGRSIEEPSPEAWSEEKRSCSVRTDAF